MVNIRELCMILNQERIFIETERENMQRLYDEVLSVASLLFQSAWIARQQKINMDEKISGGLSRKDEGFFDEHNELGSSTFIESYKVLSHHDVKYGELFKFLRVNPELLADCLVVTEKRSDCNIRRCTNIILSSLYANCLLVDDEKLVLKLLKCLTDLQVMGNTQPRHLFRRKNCAFNLFFKQFCDSIFSARLFLTAALNDPIIRLLMEDEWFYDIDPTKALVRFPAKERFKRFGDQNSDMYEIKLKEYRKFIVDKLVMLSTRFINTIKGNINCFPSSLKLLLSHVFKSLTMNNVVNPVEAKRACADLIFSLFICPAICDPEPYGITTDIPISHIARHNLMQIAQIIQILAVSSTDEIDEKVKDVYSCFEKECLSSFIDDLLCYEKDIQSTRGSDFINYTGLLISSSQLQELVSFLRGSSELLNNKTESYKQLSELLLALPLEVPNQNSYKKSTSPVHTPHHSPPDTPDSKRKGLIKGNSSCNLTNMADSEAVQVDDIKRQEEILVFQINNLADCPGMIPENKFLTEIHVKLQEKQSIKDIPSVSFAGIAPITGSVLDVQEKRTRFSLSNDQESIGNTSDNIEMTSEAASSHSVDIDQEFEENDNLSDMVSANVSGRGSPSVSGRDTPIFQVGEDRSVSDLSVHVPTTIKKHNREDVTERFGKFEIKTEFERDEAKSTVSDTWSTDVLASDSEPPEQNQLERLVEVVEDITINNLPATISKPPLEPTSGFDEVPALNSDSSVETSTISSVTTDYSNFKREMDRQIFAANDMFTTNKSKPLLEISHSEENKKDDDVFIDVVESDNNIIGESNEDSIDFSVSKEDFEKTNLCSSLPLNVNENQEILKNTPLECDASFDDKRLSVALTLFDALALDNDPTDILEASSSACTTKEGDGSVDVENNMDNDAIVSGVSVQEDAEKKDLDVEPKSEKYLKKSGLLRSLKDKFHTSIKKRSIKTGDEEKHQQNMEGLNDKENNEESLDEMLNKYRRKKNSKGEKDDLQEKIPETVTDEDNYYLDDIYTFQDTKRKLRLVLSTSDFHMLSRSSEKGCNSNDNELIDLLRAQLAESINLQNKAHIAQLHEVIRCLKLFDSFGVQKIIQSLHTDQEMRKVYISYLIRCRQGLQSSLAHLNRLNNRTVRVKEIGTRHLINACSRLFLEKNEAHVLKFYGDFQYLKMADEKTQLVEKFLETMYREMEQDTIWAAATETQLEEACLAVERNVMSRIYTHALFPNGDGDISRDQVYKYHIRKLSLNIKPTDPALCIPQKYHFECPWPAAQRELFLINAFKTPKDKLGCILRCSTTIMNLLSMSDEKSVPAADDFMPVLIYVIIRANPPFLLSTLQYVHSFYENRLVGEESYWWFQFSSALEFIKTMEYKSL